MNTLMDYNLQEGFLAMSPSFKYFTFITNENGQILYFDQIETLPYKASVLRPEGVEDEQFDVHFAYANQIGRAHSELQSLMRISYAVFCLKKKKQTRKRHKKK